MRVCLIVDNPLRDLDGLVLVAFQLAIRGVQVWLVPMYDQAFDVFAVRPDWVVVNYVRPNNVNLLRLYKRAGFNIAVLDTEGASGYTADDFAGMVKQSGGAALIDRYCVWGRDRFNALAQQGAVDANALRLTGCPRYDFCSLPWRSSLPMDANGSKYILINTNFPVVNPRFASDSNKERHSIIQAGYAPDFADAYIRDARAAHAGMIDMIEQLLVVFPKERFVLRPHPFEQSQSYKRLCKWPNFEIRREGTSVEWVDKASLLIHLTCSTAIEAVMLGCEPISPAWLETPVLRVPGPHAVSRQARTMAELIVLLRRTLDGQLDSDLTLDRARREVIDSLYYKIDGKTAERVSQAILSDPQPSKDIEVARASLRIRGVRLAQKLLGYDTYKLLRKIAVDRDIEKRRVAKLFNVKDVELIIRKLVPLSQLDINIHCTRHPAGSGKSVRVSAEEANLTTGSSN